MATGPRKHSFVVRLSNAEKAVLEELVAETGLNKSDVIRQALRRWRDAKRDARSRRSKEATA